MRRRIHMQKNYRRSVHRRGVVRVLGLENRMGEGGPSTTSFRRLYDFLLALAVIGRVFRLPWSDYLTYLLIVCIFGLVLNLFLLFDVVNVIYPTLLCIACCAIFLAGLLIFRGEEILFELQKRMHV